MPMQILGTTRRGVLQAAAVGALGAALPASALAAPQTPAPQGDDLGFLAFGVVAEGVLAAFYTQALGIGGAWSRSERATLRAAHGRHRSNIDRLNAALGPGDAVGLDDFSRRVRVGTRAGALNVGRGLERLTSGVYLTGAGYAADAGTRVLLGRLLAVSHGYNTLLGSMAGITSVGMPAPADLDAAGLKLDTYLKDPTA